MGVLYFSLDDSTILKTIDQHLHISYHIRTKNPPSYYQELILLTLVTIIANYFSCLSRLQLNQN